MRNRCRLQLLAAATLLLACQRIDEDILVAFHLIDENQTRCLGFASDLGQVWSDSLGQDVDLSLTAYYLEELETIAAIGAATERIAQVMAEVDRPRDAASLNALLFDGYALNRSICELALNPTGRSLLTFRERKAELQDEYLTVAAKLEILLGPPPEDVLTTLADHRSFIAEAEAAVTAAKQRSEEELREKERIERQVTREALRRRREAEAEIRAREQEQRRIEAAILERDRRQQEEADQRVAAERRRKQEDLERERRRLEEARLRRVREEMAAWHPTYLQTMKPIRVRVGEVDEAWKRATVDAKPACQRLAEALRSADRRQLLGSPDAALNSRLKAMVDGLDRSATLCQAGARFQAESQLKEAIQNWGAAGRILQTYSLSP